MKIVLIIFVVFAFEFIISPSKTVLKNIFIQLAPYGAKHSQAKGEREEDGSVSYPRYPFSLLIFSEEIKDAIKMGYDFKMLWGFIYNRGKNVFSEYVNTIFKEKKEICLILIKP